MSSDERTVGMILARLDTITTDIGEIKDGKMAVCQLHSATLQRIEKKLDGRNCDDDEGGFLSWVKGKGLKSKGLPAVILSIFIGLSIAVAVLQYQHAEQIATKAAAEASSVARDTVVREGKAEAKRVVREEIAAVLKEIKEVKP